MLDKYLLAARSDIPRLITALAEWTSCMLSLALLPRRPWVKGWRMAACAGFLLLVLISFLIMTEGSVLLLWFPCMVAAFLIMCLFMMTVLNLGFPGIVYRTCTGFLLAELAASLTWQICSYARFISGIESLPLETVILFSVFLLVYGVFTLIIRRYMIGRNPIELTWKDTFPQIILTLIIFVFSNLSFVMPRTPFTSQTMSDIHNLRTLTDLAGLAIIFAVMTRLYDLRAERELIEIGNILKGQYETYRSYQESIDLINMKYHDLKHQLDGLRGETDPEKRREWIDAMDRELQDYRPERQTGSPVLDTILSGKMVRVRNSRITFTCVADGKLLDFIHVIDLCTIFGNALDNAIEAAALVEDAERRMVHMSVSRKKNFLMITLRNTTDGELELRPDGNPATTKADAFSHGYGLKSIRQAVSKYGGTAEFGIRDGFFTLQIMIPIPQDRV